MKRRGPSKSFLPNKTKKFGFFSLNQLKEKKKKINFLEFYWVFPHWLFPEFWKKKLPPLGVTKISSFFFFLNQIFLENKSGRCYIEKIPCRFGWRRGFLGGLPSINEIWVPP